MILENEKTFKRRLEELKFPREERPYSAWRAGWMATLHVVWPGGTKRKVLNFSGRIYGHMNFSLHSRMIENILYALSFSLIFPDITLFWFPVYHLRHFCFDCLSRKGLTLALFAFLILPFIFSSSPLWNLRAFASAFFKKILNPSFTHDQQWDLSKIKFPRHFPAQNRLAAICTL